MRRNESMIKDDSLYQVLLKHNFSLLKGNMCISDYLENHLKQYFSDVFQAKNGEIRHYRTHKTPPGGSARRGLVDARRGCREKMSEMSERMTKVGTNKFRRRPRMPLSVSAGS